MPASGGPSTTRAAPGLDPALHAEHVQETGVEKDARCSPASVPGAAIEYGQRGNVELLLALIQVSQRDQRRAGDMSCPYSPG